jgi:Fe-S-cluster-containing hydrogenase component 2
VPEKQQSGEQVSFDGGTVLFKEGDPGDGLYLLRSGSVTVSRALGGRDVVLSYVAAGNYVGEMALVNDAPRMATVRAAVATEAIVLDGGHFKEVIARHPQLRAELEQQVLSRIAENVKMETETTAGGLIGYLVGQGLGEATDVLLIDESLCVRCNNCEKACADTHDGTSRLDREAGPTYAQIHVPTSCRHCEHPHCMKDCPPDAIRRAPNGEVFISDRCIGCGNCQRNCPYGVIQMGYADAVRHRPSLLTWLFAGIGEEPGMEAKAPHDAHDKPHPKKAVKCDMCKDQKGGAACVRACPTGAALRVKPGEFLAVTGGQAK